MIRPFKIKAQKDSNGFYILPPLVFKKEEVISNLRYHESTMKDVKNLMFAIICITVQDRDRDTNVNGWTKDYVRVNNVLLPFENYFLDEEENIIYEMDNKDELKTLQRYLKLKKLAQHGV
jgi:hypothetical protein